MSTSLALAIPYETEEGGEAVFVRVEVWRLADKFAEKPEIEYLRLLPRFGFPEPITEEEFREAVAASLEARRSPVEGGKALGAAQLP